MEPEETCVISMINSVTGSHKKLNAVVEEDAEIIFVPVERAKEWMKKYPEWSDFILETYEKRFDHLLNQLKSVSEEKLETRVLKYLNNRRKISGEKILPITHQHLANDLSTNRVVISRLLKNLENKGILKLGRNKIEMCQTV